MPRTRPPIGSRHRVVPTVLVAAAWALALVSSSLVAAQDVGVRVAGLRIVGPGFGANGSEIQPFREGPGLTLALVLEAPAGKKIVEIDDDQSDLASITDDLGSDLRSGVDWGFFPQITEDGRYGLIELVVSERPAAGARRLSLQGSIALRLAGQTRVERREEVSFERGAVFELDGGRLEVEVAGKDEEWDGGVRVVLGTTTAFHDTISDLRFLDAEGQVIETQGSGTTTIGSQVQRETYLSTDTVPAGFEIERFEGLEALVVPFSLDAGLGLDG